MAALKGKVAWITGGGTGIGRAGALALAGAGATVVVSGRSEKTLAETVALARAAKARGKVTAMALDVADKQAVAATADAILDRHGAIDILVNSAGTNVPERAWRAVRTSGWDEVVSANLDGLFYCCHAALPAMRARRDGLIVNVSSWLGRYVSALGGPAYIASKFGVSALTETINAEEGANGIRACVICPGEVATPIMDKRPVKPAQETLDRMLQEEDLGRTILFVATLPARACVNEIVISPTHNRFYVGGFERPPAEAGAASKGGKKR